jgi:hypothetical protein
MFRAIKMFNGGEEVEYRHFDALNAAYEWLTPSNQRQEQERWHLKMFNAVRREIDAWNLNVVTVGWNEQNAEETCYIQRVQAWNDALPHF